MSYFSLLSFTVFYNSKTCNVASSLLARTKFSFVVPVLYFVLMNVKQLFEFCNSNFYVQIVTLLLLSFLTTK